MHPHSPSPRGLLRRIAPCGPQAAAALALIAAGLFAQPERPFLFGVGTHHPDSAEYFSLMKQAGVMAIRDDFSWSRCEKEKGKIEVPEAFAAEVQRSLDQGLTTICILDYANKLYDDGGYPRSAEAVEAFAKYSEAVVKALKGKIKYYQIWNEWDGGCGMTGKGRGDAESYVKLAKVVYPRIKAIDPSCVVLANSVCTGDAFLMKTVELGVLKACDAVTLHTYFYGDPVKTLVNHWWPRMTNLDRFLRDNNGGKPFPLYATEIGWPTQVDPRGCTEAVSADQLTKLYALALSLPYIRGLWWYDFRDDGWDSRYNENNFGMTRRDLTPKKSYFAYKDVASLLSDAVFVGRMDAGDPALWLLKYRRPGGKFTWAAWAETNDVDLQLALGTPKSTAVTLCQPGFGRVERRFTKANEADPEAKMELVLRDRPWLFEGEVENLRIIKKGYVDFKESSRPQKTEIRIPTVYGRAVEKSSPAKAPVYRFGDESDYRRVMEAKRAGSDDLDASLSLRWDKAKLSLTVTVRDDVFFQEKSGADTWDGDGIQFALHPFDGEPGNTDHFDYDVALTKAGPAAWRQIGARGLVPGAVGDMNPRVARNGNQVVYEVDIPATAMGLAAFRGGQSIGFSLVVNDNDGKGRKGYLRWGDGIGAGKDPSLYALITLEE